MDPIWSLFTHKWTRSGHCVILGPDGSCDCIIVQVGFWIELPVQRILFPDFVKLLILVNGTQRCGIELHDIHRLSAG